MLVFLDADRAVRARCEALGLSFEHACRLADEDGSSDPKALHHVLGLDLFTLAPLKARRWLWMAAKTASVSYRGELTEATLLAALTTGQVPTEFMAHIGHLLDEAPIQIVVMAVEQAAQQSGLPIEVLWDNVARLAVSVSYCRQRAWLVDDQPPTSDAH